MLQSETRRARLVLLLPVALVSIAAVRLYLEFRGCGLLGWDTYPLIETSRIQSWADVFDIVRTSLMGKAEGGLYYRPVPKLVFAVDYALWGLWPPGYHLVSVGIFVAAALAVHRLASRLGTPGAALGPMAALVFFLAHPVHATVVPVASRRPDMLCLLFMALSLAAQADAGCGRASRRWLAAGLAVLALLSKEAAFILPPLALVVAFVSTSARGVSRRAADAVKAALPTFAVAAIVLLLRIAVLGGLVGERPMQDSALISATFRMLQRVFHLMLSGEAIVRADGFPFVLLAVLLGALLAGIAVARRERCSRALAGSVAALVVGVAWIVLISATYAVGLILQPWYLVSPVAALALVVGGLSQGSGAVLRQGRAARAPAALALASLCVLTVRLGGYSPLFRSYQAWHDATEIGRDYLSEIRSQIDAADVGAVVATRKVPMVLGRKPGREHLAGVAILAPYSVDAWTRLVFPERKIRVVYGPDKDHSADEDGVVVLLGASPRPGSIAPRDAHGR